MSFKVVPIPSEDGKDIVGYEVCDEKNNCQPCDSEDAANKLAEELNWGNGGDDEGDGNGPT